MSESIGFIRRKIHGESDSDESDPLIMDSKLKKNSTPVSDSAIPLAETTAPRNVSATTTSTTGDRRSRRLSTYTPLPLANSPDPEPYDAVGFEGAGMRGPRYYSPPSRPAVGTRVSSGEELPEVRTT